jgi:hypothetical protein
MRLLANFLLTTGLVLGLSCGGSGGGSVTKVFDFEGSFDPAEPNPLDDTVSLDSYQTDGSFVTIAVDVTGVDGIFGASFEVIYNTNMAEFAGWSPGTVLERGGNVPNYTVDGAQGGLVAVVATRTGGGSGTVDVGPSEPLILLTFQVIAEGTSLVGFRNAWLDDDTPPDPIQNISWFGGTLVAI